MRVIVYILKSIVRFIFIWIVFSVLLFIALSLTGCKGFYLKQAVKHNPEIFKDSIEIRKYDIYDTSFFLNEKDTIVLNNTEKIKTVIYRDKNNFDFNQTVTPDTLIIKEIHFNREAEKDLIIQKKINKYVFIMTGLFFVLAIIFLIVLIKLKK